jgi:hypothetical protein
MTDKALAATIPGMKSIKESRTATDSSSMPRRPSIRDRIAAALPKSREAKVLVIVNTVRGPVAVPVPKRKLFR